MILLDTHVVVWAVGDIPTLGRSARDIIARDADCRVSAMVAWEVAMMAEKGRLTSDVPLDRWIGRSLRSLDAREVPVSVLIATDAGSLKAGIHGDPCDRIMIATARALNCPLMTADEKILGYAAAGHLKAIDARV
ncbi:MAG: type II toxin-antitoxin system VapC family toxin [Sphingomonas adhaesiva]|uniref:type II toxin-antitoxin system VapC family toxin n=1 Tax=Sphingomonas adhaesiva TaxID=28212 RepID=UPI002FF4617A